MVGWIIGEHAGSNLEAIYRAFSSKRVADAEKIYGKKISRYHPILANPKNLKSIPFPLLKLALQDSEVTCLSGSYLKSAEVLYKLPSNLNILSESEGSHSIAVEVLQQNPQAQDELNCAVNLIVRDGGWLGSVFSKIVSQVIPIRNHLGDYRFYGAFSDYDVLGAIFTSFPTDVQNRLELSTSIVHELGHQALMLMQAGQSPIVSDDFRKPVYSAIRETERPAIGAFHSVVALAYMYEFQRILVTQPNSLSADEKRKAREMSVKSREKLQVGLSALESIELSTVGRRIIKDIERL